MTAPILSSLMQRAPRRHLRRHRMRQVGFSLIELMIALGLGLFLTGAIVSVYLVQSRMVKSSTSQAGLQNAENAIAALITPVVRSAGFNGCSTLSQAVSNLVAGGPPPLGTLGTGARFLVGYEASNTGVGNTLTVPTNAANSGVASNWTTALDSTLVTAGVQAGSDVLVLLGAAPNTAPVGVVSIPATSPTFTVQDATGLAAGQFGIVSDCLKSSVFKITGVAGTAVTHAAGTAITDNASATLALTYPAGSQFVPLQQTAFFVAQGNGGQSILMRATYAGSTWSAQQLVPGVETLQILYGVGSNGIVNKYVPASAGLDWSTVYAVRLGFLLQGQIGSGGPVGSGSQSFDVLGTTVQVPTDGRLRHVFEMTVNLRNAS